MRFYFLILVVGTDVHFKYFFKTYIYARWWHTPLIPALGRLRQADLCEFETSLVFKS